MSRPRARLFVSPLEDRLTPSSAVPTNLLSAIAPYAVGSRAGQPVAASVYKGDGTVDFTVTPFASGIIGGVQRTVTDGTTVTRTESFTVTPFAAGFTGGVRTALADVTGDGTADLIVAAGPGGGSAVEVYDGVTHALVTSFSAYESTFTGGTYVAAADLNGDGRAEIVTGAAEGGGPRVKVFDGASVTTGQTPTTLDDFMAIDDPNFRGGVRLSLGDIGGDGVPDLLVGAGQGGGSRVAAFDGATLAKGQQVKLFADFFAFEPGLRNGVFPTVGDLNGDGRCDLVFGAGPGGGPRVLALDGRAAVRGVQTQLANFFAGDSTTREGVEVGVQTAADGTASIVYTNLATNTTSGLTQAGLTGGPFGVYAGHSLFGGGYTQADASAVSQSLVGSYSGTGTGLLTSSSGTVALTGSSAAVTVKVDITTATAVVPIYRPTPAIEQDGRRTYGLGVSAVDPSTPTPGTAPLRQLTITGTVTLTTDSGTLTLPVTGTFVLARGKSTDTGTARGVLWLSTDRTGADPTPLGTGLALTAGVSADGITLSRFLGTDRTASSPYLVQSPESRTAARIVLAKVVAAPK